MAGICAARTITFENVMTQSVPQFSLVIGGPAHRLMGWLGLLDPDRLPTWRGALVMAGVAWLPPALLSAASYIASADASMLSYFIDYPTHIRYIIAISVMVITERTAHFRLMPIIQHFRESRLVADSALPVYHREVAKADRLTASWFAEASILIVVLVAAASTMSIDIELDVFDWDGRVVEGQAVYSWAGAWSHWVSRPLFHFLLFRWIWRFLVWGVLLLRISMMPLNLLVTHPDRAGGLGFLSIYPTVFSGFLFALSCVLAAQLVSEALITDISDEQLRLIIISWVGFMYFSFTAPLLFFTRPLYRLREHTTFRLGKLASEHQHAFEDRWLDAKASGAELLGSADVSSVADLEPAAASPYTLRLIPLTLAVSVQLFLSIAIPMLAVGLARIPFSALVERILSIVQ